MTALPWLKKPQPVKQEEGTYIVSCSYYTLVKGPSWPLSYGSWILNYLCNQCLSPLVLWVWISIRTRCTTLCDKVCQWLAKGRWFSLGPPVSCTNKADRYIIAEILLKVALNTIKQTLWLTCDKLLQFYRSKSRP